MDPEEVIRNKEKARSIEFQFEGNHSCNMVDTIIDSYPLVKQDNYRLLPRITELFYDDWQRIQSYLDVILLLVKRGSVYKDIPTGNVYDVIDSFEDGINAYVKDRKQLLDNIHFDDCNNYTIKRIENFREAQDFNSFVEWCITGYEDDHESYTDGGELFYFCMKPGYKNESKDPKDGFPWDDYGKSLFAVSVNRHGLIANVTSRWNIESTGIHKIDDEALSRMIGRNFYEVFLPREIS